MAMRSICAAMLISAAVVSGCGSSDKAKTTRTAPPMATVSPAEKVIRGWAESLRSGNVKRAATYFAVPSTVSNSGTPLKLQTRAEAEFFNTTLPCGAKVVRTKAIAHGFTLATFQLTERPGEGVCGPGTGDTARVAIRVRKGKITDWRRAADLPRIAQEST
jgi:hypothetical protein